MNKKTVVKRNKILIILLLVFSLFVSVFVFNTPVIASSDYYSSISSSETGDDLKSSLRSLITSTHKTKTSYDDCSDPSIVEKTDGDPNNPGNIILFWSGLSIESTWDNGTSWNREHVWPQSQGWFSKSGAGADLHHIRPTDSSVNSSHGNYPYGVVSGGKYVSLSSTNGGTATDAKVGGSIFEPGDSKKGDCARIIFYLLVRYEDSDNYSITNVATSMDLLLEWNNNDPVDASEIRRNNAVYDIQGNRNPFIDNSNYANLIWDEENASTGDNTGGSGSDTPVTNYYPVSVSSNANECSVSISGTKNGSGYYTGNVTINVTPKSGYNYLGLKDINTGQYVTTSTSYTISNISKSYYLQAVFASSETNTYSLVTDVNNLEVGDSIIIVASDYDYALSTTQNNNNRGQVAIEKVNNTIISVDGLQNIVLEAGNVSNTFAFNVGGYLYAASSSSNYLRTENTLSDNSSWSISIDSTGIASIIAQGIYTRNELKYNSSSSLFACYSSGNTQKAVSIYEKNEAIELTPVEKSIQEFQTLSTFTSLMMSYNYDGSLSNETYSYTFTSKQYSGNATVNLNGINWTLSGDTSTYYGYDGTKGQQFGSGSSPCKSLTLTSNNLSNIKSIKINTSGASSINGKMVVSVGGTQVGQTISLTSTATEYTFNNFNKSGVVEIAYTQTSSKALYIKSIEIEYSVDTTVYTLNSASLRFGSYISKELYDTLNNVNTVWGVEYAGGEVTDWSSSNVRTIVCTPAQVSEPNASVIDENGEYYQFALVVNGIGYNNLDSKISARVFVEYNGERYYMSSASRSLRDVVDLYLSLDNTTEFSEHIGVLNHLSKYEG